MQNEEIKKEVTELRIKVAGTLNILRRSPVILTYNKLLGIGQKLEQLAMKVSGETESTETEGTENKTENEGTED